MDSRKPRKQRKRLYTAPWHQRRKLLTARLSNELAEKHGIRNLIVVKGDTVLITRGSFRDSEGLVQDIDTQHQRLHIENITIDKVDGSAVPFPIPASKVMITKLKIEKGRQAIIDRRRAAQQEKPTE
jgi:large subunit ribosomal protein L24